MVASYGDSSVASDPGSGRHPPLSVAPLSLNVPSYVEQSTAAIDVRAERVELGVVPDHLEAPEVHVLDGLVALEHQCSSVGGPIEGDAPADVVTVSTERATGDRPSSDEGMEIAALGAHARRSERKARRIWRHSTKSSEDA
jgi:hypothetical protein